MRCVRVERDGRCIGEAEIDAAGPYLEVQLRAARIERVMRAYAVWSNGEVLLGVPEPTQAALILRKRLRRGLLPEHEALRVVLYDAAWSPWEGSLAGISLPGVMRRGEEIAIPFSESMLPPFFCLCRYRTIDARAYLTCYVSEAGEPKLDSSSPTGQWSEPNTSE